MASLTFPVKVWGLPAAIPGTTANPVLSTTVAIQTCHIRKREINPPLVVVLCIGVGCCFLETRNSFLASANRQNSRYRETLVETDFWQRII
jgi:uncharacterized membrane protein YfcA